MEPAIIRATPADFLAPRKTSGYVPAVVQGDFYGRALDDKPWFTHREAERMKRDPQIQFGLRVLRAPLHKCQWTVEADSLRVAKLVDSTLHTIWDGFLQPILSAQFTHGWAPAELAFRDSMGQVVLDSLDTIHPADAKPLEVDTRTGGRAFCGIRVRGTSYDQRTSPGGACDVIAPHAFWHPGEAEYGSYYGRPRLADAFTPWSLKSGKGGAVESRSLWFKKCAFRGGTMRHPVGYTEYEVSPGVTRTISNEDLAREIVERYENGGVLTLPNTMDATNPGVYLWTFEPPGTNGEASGIREYPQDLDREILVGLGIVPEVITAAETGSGYSGRSIPMMVYLSSEDEVAKLLVKTAEVQVCRPLVSLNCGPRHARRFRIVVKSLVEILGNDPQAAKNAFNEPDPRQQAGGMSGLNGGGDNGPPAVPKPKGAPPAPAVQLSQAAIEGLDRIAVELSKAAEQPRDVTGRFAPADGNFDVITQPGDDAPGKKLTPEELAEFAREVARLARQLVTESGDRPVREAAMGLVDRAEGFLRGTGEAVELSQAGRWVTIGGQKGADGKRRGGSPVFIQNGVITKGHPSLTGKKPGDIGGEAKETTHRAEVRRSQGHAVAKIRKQARQEGIDPRHLDDLAGQFREQHNAFAAERTEMLKAARRYIGDYSGKSISNLAREHDKGGKDYTRIKGFDLATEEAVKRFPHHFREENGDNGNHYDQMYEMLVAGNPEPMGEEDAYEQAFNHLMGSGKAAGEGDDDFAFGENDPDFIPLSLADVDLSGGDRKYVTEDGVEGYWITIGATEDGEGEKHGGTPVFIGKADGRIKKGPKSLEGHKPGELTGKKWGEEHLKEKRTPDTTSPNSGHKPAGTPDATGGTPDITAAQAREKEVAKLRKEITGPQVVTQPRAKHGEVGPNGETYPGGAFIATTDLPKRIKDKMIQSAKGKVRVGMSGFAVPEPGQMSIVDKLGGSVMNPRNGEINEQYLEYIRATPEERKMYAELAAKHNAGEEWVSVNDYPKLANFTDAARLYVAKQPIPGAILDKLPAVVRERLTKHQEAAKSAEASEPPAPHDPHTAAAKLKTGGATSPDEARAAREAYAGMSDADKNAYARSLGFQTPEKGLPATRDDLVHRSIREGEFRHAQEAKGIDPELKRGGALFGEPGVGESAGLFDDAESEGETATEPPAEAPAIREGEPTPDTTSYDPPKAPAATAPGVSASDIPFDVAMNAHRGMSFVPEKRALQRQADYVNQMNADYEHLSQLADTPEKREQLAAEFERYRAGYQKHYLDVLHASSRILSPMIAGPARFPVDSNNKKIDTHHNRITDLIEFRKRAMAAITRKVSPESGPVRSSDPAAVETLTKQIEAAQKRQDLMKQANKIIQAHTTYVPGSGGGRGEYVPPTFEFKKGKTREDLEAALKGMGMEEPTIRELLKPNYMGKIGFEGYQLTNNNANIRRMQDRVEELKKLKASPHKEESYSGGVKVVEDPEAARIRIVFPGKPDRETIGKLKSGGFRWSPSEGAWQRHLNTGGRQAVDSMLKQLGHTKEESAVESEADSGGEDKVPPMLKVPEPEEPPAAPSPAPAQAPAGDGAKSSQPAHHEPHAAAVKALLARFRDERGGVPEADVNAVTDDLKSLSGPDLFELAKAVNADATLSEKSPKGKILKQVTDMVRRVWKTSDNVNN